MLSAPRRWPRYRRDSAPSTCSPLSPATISEAGAGMVLKVGRPASNSDARFRSQHYTTSTGFDPGEKLADAQDHLVLARHRSNAFIHREGLGARPSGQGTHLRSSQLTASFGATEDVRASNNGERIRGLCVMHEVRASIPGRLLVAPARVGTDFGHSEYGRTALGSVTVRWLHFGCGGLSQ